MIRPANAVFMAASESIIGPLVASLFSSLGPGGCPPVTVMRGACFSGVVPGAGPRARGPPHRTGQLLAAVLDTSLFFMGGGFLCTSSPLSPSLQNSLVCYIFQQLMHKICLIFVKLDHGAQRRNPSLPFLIRQCDSRQRWFPPPASACLAP